MYIYIYIYIRHLVDEEYPRDELCDSLVNVLVDDLVDFGAQLLCDLSLLGLHHRAHHAEKEKKKACSADRVC